MTAAATSAPFALDASGVADATTFAFTPGASGSFAFQASYSGDGTYNGSTGPCEPLIVTKVASSTVTVIHNAAHQVVTSVPAGTTVHDQATVTGCGLATPTGTVTFDWFTNGTCAGRAGGDVGPVRARRLWCRGRDDVPADAEHRRDVRIPGVVLG